MATSLNWENLTAPDFARAVETTRGTCIVPIGVIEKHGPHLPLGTDLLTARKLAGLAVQIEPAVVFPPYYFTQIHEAKHQPGAIALPFRLMFDLLESTCEEIARNGLKKIILLNGHGGNNYFLPYFAQAMLEKPRDYTVYVLGLNAYLPDGQPQWQQMRQTKVDGHAGEEETSIMLALHPELCRLDQIQPSGESGQPLHRAKHLAGLYNAIGWYADFPNHYAGDGAFGTKDKGQFIADHAAKRIAELIRIAKNDDACPSLTSEFHARTRHG